MLALERPPRWGLIAIVVLLAANAALVVLLVQRNAPTPQATAPAAASTNSSTSPSSPSTSPAGTTSASPTDDASTEPGVLAVYGDGYSSGNSEGGTGAAGWPALVAQQLGMELQLSAATLAGYVRPGSTGQTYPQLVQAQPPTGAGVTVVFGSRNDVDASPAEVQSAAAQTFQAITAADPETELLVIGPCWSSADVPAELEAVASAVQQAAQAAGATYVDPIAQGWFADPAGLVSPIDGISILDPGHAYLADLIGPLVSAELAR
ncbi:GDSL-type esterase/lipase family protein [Klenkia sp. LSe6-5]|uniref:GDSL-type esterase/lipase family protein n=1 Tax=Klenkia sesuvii TaxID=3103137 RepID=A0ABU8DYC5_9ACTN